MFLTCRAASSPHPSEAQIFRPDTSPEILPKQHKGPYGSRGRGEAMSFVGKHEIHDRLVVLRIVGHDHVAFRFVHPGSFALVRSARALYLIRLEKCDCVFQECFVFAHALMKHRQHGGPNTAGSFSVECFRFDGPTMSTPQAKRVGSERDSGEGCISAVSCRP